jgi:geranylgeranyl reductase family protein
MRPSDVLIVGAGPAGSAAGTFLARRGVAVRVLDQARFPRDKVCGDALSNGAIELLRQMGTRLDDIPHAPVRGAVAVLPDGYRIKREFGDRPGAIAPRRELDDLLRRTMEGSGAELLQGVRATDLVRQGTRVCGVVAGTREFKARLVIVADGAGSLAWASMNRPYPRGVHLGLAATRYFRFVDTTDVGYSEHYFRLDLPLGYGWVFPAVDGVANVGVYQRADRSRTIARSLRQSLDHFVADMPRSFARAQAVGRVRTWALPLCVTPASWPGSPGLLVCGDAGRFVDPLSGEGIWQALETGRLAAHFAFEALSGNNGVLDRRALSRYRRACARRINAPSLVKLGIQQGLQLLLDRGLYREGIVRTALRWGYGTGRLEASKSVCR